MKIYLAGPFFSKAEQSWISFIKEKIEQHVSEAQIICPADFVIDIADPEDLCEIRKEIFRQVIQGLRTSDLLVSLLDGVQVDDETAMAIGYFRAAKRDALIVGLRTDFRRTGGTCNEEMIAGVVDCACNHIFVQIDKLVDFLTSAAEEIP